MATFNKHQPFAEHVYEGVHVFGTHQLAVALTAAANAPTATMATKSQLTEISYTNLSSRNVTTSSSSQTSGVYKLVLTDLVLTASGGSVGPFRYIDLFNDTPTSPADPVIGWYDYGSDQTLLDTETFTIDWDGTNGAIQHS
jgi:hypothetical protein